jgi:Cation efflux family
VEIIIGYMTNSMSLVADSFHMLGDIAALVISFLSVKVSMFKKLFELLIINKIINTDVAKKVE